MIGLATATRSWNKNSTIMFITGDGGVWGLKKNFALLELLERLQVSQDRNAHCSSGVPNGAVGSPGLGRLLEVADRQVL